MEAPLSIKEDTSVLHFCSACAHLIGIRHADNEAERWKCGAPQNEKGIDLVTGRKTFKTDSCRQQRNLLGAGFCGVEGKWFQLYEQPRVGAIVPIGGKTSKSALSTLTLDDI